MHNYVVSDIHGNSERLRFLLSSLKRKHSNGDFVLHIIGDVFDRGNSSAEVYNILIKNKDNINLLLGNHEYMFMDFMEEPKSFIQWQMNGAYPTIESFAEEFMTNLLNDDIIFEHRMVRDLYAESYKITQSKINKLFGRGKQNEVQAYIDELKNTTTDRDMRTISLYIKNRIRKECPHLERKNKVLVENICYLLILDKFCELYKYFSMINPYAIVDDKYLLVHSGFVSKSTKENITDSVPKSFYRPCRTREDLDFQDFYPMLWSRRFDKETNCRFAPNEKFDGLTIIFGHTIVSNFRKNNSNSLNPLITYDANGEIASIGIDGKNYDRENGQLNCICLDDLSLMMVTGSNKIHSTNNHSKPLTISKLPPILNKNHKQHELPEVGD